MYLSVVFCNLLRIGLLIAAINDLQDSSCKIQNTYLIDYFQKRNYIIARPEIRVDEGLTMIMGKSLYRLMSSSAAFPAHLMETLNNI